MTVVRRKKRALVAESALQQDSLTQYVDIGMDVASRRQAGKELFAREAVLEHLAGGLSLNAWLLLKHRD